MNAGQGKAWSGPQLAAELAARGGVAPDPTCHVVFRATRRAEGGETRGYEVPDQAHAVAEGAWPRWLQQRGLLGRDQLRVAVLVIREVLDQASRLVEGVLERRRGGADGPFYGNPARVEFVGAARRVRSYRATQGGQLLEVAPSPRLRPPGAHGVEPPAGERQALERHFGADIQVLDTREPTLFEDMAGLTSIIHVRRRDGREIACGIGWHGPIAFVLVADFPRFDVPPTLPPADETAVQEALNRHGLVRHETRLDTQGPAVVARRQGGEPLFLLRPTAGRIAVTPYQPGAASPASEDQGRWLRYVETHERLLPLDHYRDGRSDHLVVLTGDAGGHVRRHYVDADGVETTRRPADDTAVAWLYRDHLSSGRPIRPDAAMPGISADHRLPQLSEAAAPRDSLLAKGRAFVAAMAALHAATNAALADPVETGFPPALFDSLHRLKAASETLAADYAAGQVAALQSQAQAGTLDSNRLIRELTRLEAGLQEELSLIRMVALRPVQWRRLNDPAPFGTEVGARFPACAHDIEEAANCLAFRRPTAAVFHCTRILERGLLALGRTAGVSRSVAPQSGWSDILAGLRAACPPALVPVLAQLQQVRRHWRGSAPAPAEKYTEAEAELVFQSVGAFMRELAEHCDERGEAMARPPAGRERHAR